MLRRSTRPHTRHDRPPPGARKGFTLTEFLIATTIMTVLLAGMMGAVMIATRSLDRGAAPPEETAASREIVNQIARDLHFATTFSERTDRAITFSVPDRDGDRVPETVRYTWEGVPGVSPGPLKYQYNDGPEITLAESAERFQLDYRFRAMAGTGVTALPTAPGLLLVVADAMAPTSQDQARIALIEGWGYEVTTISAYASQGSFDTAVATVDVAYVVEQGQSTVLSTKLRDAAVGVVVEEAELCEHFGFSANRDWPSPRNFVDVVDNVHPITSPFPVGTLQILDSDREVVSLAGHTADGLEVLAEHDWTGSQPGLAVIEAGGGALLESGPAAGRRVQLPWGRTGFDINALNGAGELMMRRAIDWAAGGGGGGGGGSAPADFGYTTEFPTPVSSVEQIQIATLVTLPGDGVLNSITAYVGGANKGVRYAIYSDDAGEPDRLLVESPSMDTTNSVAWLTIPVPPTVLSAGDYWLALAFDFRHQRYHQKTGGQTRYVSHDAEKDGFLSDWGFSDDSFGIKISIYGTCTPN